MDAGKFTLAYENLSGDGATPQPGVHGVREDLDEAVVRRCLESFAAIPATELIEVDARIQLSHKQRQVIVSRSGSVLFFTPMPEFAHTPERTTPDGILAFMAGTEPGPAMPPAETVMAAKSLVIRPRFQLPLGAQIALFAILISVLAGLTHQQIQPLIPAGYALIRDPDMLKELPRRYDGEYGGPATPNGLRFRISDGTMQIYGPAAPDAPIELLRQSSFRYALREDFVALLGDKGDILEFNVDGSLLFGETSYPRIDNK